MDATDLPQPPRAERSNMWQRALYNISSRYDEQQREYMMEVYKALLSTMVACGIGLWLQWRKLCQLELGFAMMLSALFMLLTYYRVFSETEAWTHLLALGFVSGFVLEAYVRLAYEVLGSRVWHVFMHGSFIFDLLLLSGLFAPQEPLALPVDTSWLCCIHIGLFVISTLDVFMRSATLNVLLVMAHLGSAFVTVPFDTKRLVRQMVDGHHNVVLGGMTLFVDLYAVMRDLLMLSIMKEHFIMWLDG